MIFTFVNSNSVTPYFELCIFERELERLRKPLNVIILLRPIYYKLLIKNYCLLLSFGLMLSLLVWFKMITLTTLSGFYCNNS